MAGLLNFKPLANLPVLGFTGLRQSVIDTRAVMKSVSDAMEAVTQKAAAAGVRLDGVQTLDAKTLDCLVDECADLVAENMSLEDEIASLTERLDEAKQPLDSATAACRGVAKLREKPGAEIAEAVSALPREMREAMERLLAAHMDAEEDISQLHTLGDGAEEDEDGQVRPLRNIRRRRGAAGPQSGRATAELQQQLDAARRELSKARIDANKQGDEADQCRQKPAETSKTAQDQIRALREEVEGLARRKDELEEQVAGLTDDVEAQQARIGRLEDDAERSEAVVEAGAGKLRTQLEEKDTEIALLEAEVIRLEGAAEDARNAQVEQLEAELAGKETHIKELEESMERLDAAAALHRSDAAAYADERSKWDELEKKLGEEARRHGEERDDAVRLMLQKKRLLDDERDQVRRLRAAAAKQDLELDKSAAKAAASDARVRELEELRASDAVRLQTSDAVLATSNDAMKELKAMARRSAAGMARAKARAANLRRIRATEVGRHRRHVRLLQNGRDRAEAEAGALVRSTSASFGAACRHLLGIEQCSTDWLLFATGLEGAGAGAMPRADGDAVQWHVACKAALTDSVLPPIQSDGDRLDLVVGGLRAAADSSHCVDHARVLLLLNHVNRVLSRAERAPGDLLVQVLGDLARRIPDERLDAVAASTMLAVLHGLCLLAHRFAVPGAAALLDALQHGAHVRQPPVAMLFPVLAATGAQEREAFAADCDSRGCLFDGRVVLALGADCLCVADLAARSIQALPRASATWSGLKLSIRGLESGTGTLSCTQKNLSYLVDEGF